MHHARLFQQLFAACCCDSDTTLRQFLARHPELIDVRFPPNLIVACRCATTAVGRMTTEDGDTSLVATCRCCRTAIDFQDTPLIAACRFGHLATAKALLELGANVNGTAKKNRTALHVAALTDNADIVSTLLRHDANGNATDSDSTTPLFIATEANHLRVMEVLLANDADPNTPSYGGRTPLHEAAFHGNVNVVQLLLTYGAEVNSVSRLGETPLHTAVWRDNCDIAAMLLAHGARVDAATQAGRTSLFAAVSGNRYDFVQLLLAHGANVDAIDIHGESPLVHVAARCDVSVCIMASLLSNYADVSRTQLDGRTLLHAAAQVGHSDNVRVLLAEGANVDAHDAQGLTPLDYAHANMHKRVISLLSWVTTDAELPSRKRRRHEADN